MFLHEILRTIAVSERFPARAIRRSRRFLLDFTLPAPVWIVRPLLWLLLALRTIYHFLVRILVCEPLFKARCAAYGRGVRTDVYLHWIQGSGDIVLGDNVIIDGKCSIMFATRYSDRPLLKIGSNSGIGHGCSFTIGKSITIGNNCRIARDVWLFDSSGHAADPGGRRAGAPPASQDVKPIVIEDNVWVGGRSIIFPGVTIRHGSIVSAGSVVTTDVPAFTVVAGNPARRVGSLTPDVAQEA